ncbi:MAG: GerMN domain-containing protein [Ignavibacteriales bacterium]|nr:GerMN domain-containing protein [Ignavibacteriales bacterium]
MKKRKLILFISIIILSIFIISCNGNGPKEISVNIYLVAYQGSNLNGKKIGCNDILVPITKNVLVENNEVESALNELLITKDSEELKNFVKGPSLLVYQVTIADGIADVYLKGDFHMSAVCDIPRIKEQLYETTKQFSDIKEVKIYINDKTLESYLTVAQEGFK